MKKLSIISLITAAATLFVLSAAFSVSAELVTVYERKDNIALNKTYEASEAYTTDSPTMGYQEVDGNELTDGILHTDNIYGTCWHGFYVPNGTPFFATIDLGMQTEGLIEFRMQFINYATSGIDAPVSLEFFISDDNTTFTSIGKGRAESGNNIAFYHLKLKEPVSARYVKAVIGNPSSGTFVFCSEFEIYNSVAVQKEASEISEESEYEEESEEVSEVTELIDKTEDLNTDDYPVAFREGSRFYIDNGYVYGVKPDDTPATLLENLNTIAGVVILDADGTEITSGNVYGGCKIAQFTGGQAENTYTVIIAGDTDGKAGVTESDADVVKSAILNGAVPEGETVSGDINKNGVFCVTDYIAVKLQAAGKIDLYADYTETPETWDMKIKYSSSALYTMSCTAANGKNMTLTFDKKGWGTWNIGTLTVGGVSLAGGGTDWEYVYRASSYSGGCVWSGGNHGNENLVEMKFYDGITGKELIFDKVGAEHSVGNLVIVEKTKLHWGDAEVTYCDVVRTYTVVGQKISLKVSYDFTKDCYYGLSYTCMFPVPKTVGLYIDFLNDDGTVRT
ncbi:MAG: discoidin domain-containing protein, partial [Eubacteriales bacterium]|nr:discoidin domain-containing protein [Eubacteriales bacterium]